MTLILMEISSLVNFEVVDRLLQFVQEHHLEILAPHH